MNLSTRRQALFSSFLRSPLAGDRSADVERLLAALAALGELHRDLPILLVDVVVQIADVVGQNVDLPRLRLRRQLRSIRRDLGLVGRDRGTVLVDVGLMASPLGSMSSRLVVLMIAERHGWHRRQQTHRRYGSEQIRMLHRRLSS